MPPRPPLHSPTGSYYPPNDAATYRDLLLFEERLKSNAAVLNARKRRYQLFLVQLLAVIVFLLSEVLLQSNWLGLPYKWVLHQALPEIYPEDADVRVHPYFASGLLFVSVTTLVLFFASGMYSEKIGYANKYVPHANRALRSFNMHLNMRQPPLRSMLPFNPFAFLFARPSSPPPVSPTSPTSSHSARRRSPSPSPGQNRRSSSVPISPIPPASNPRGELIFSSRVDRSFRDSYERYRAQFERRKEERARAAYSQTWLGWIHLKMPWMRHTPTATSPVPSSGNVTPSGSIRGPSGRGRVTGSPAGSRRSSPVPGRTGRKISSSGSVGSSGGTPPAHTMQHPLASGSVRGYDA
ncbi:Spo7-like protein-domain-containing protein [Daedaleopsis nitida]|nr:Spo7-like protein-domain-containing protein [Daedaleopsis nitida]